MLPAPLAVMRQRHCHEEAMSDAIVIAFHAHANRARREDERGWRGWQNIGEAAEEGARLK